MWLDLTPIKRLPSTNASPVSSLPLYLPSSIGSVPLCRENGKNFGQLNLHLSVGRGGAREGNNEIPPTFDDGSIVLIPEAGKALKSEQTKSYGESLVLDPVDPV